MVEKLNYGWQTGGGYIEPTRERVCDKINEIVDAVNKQEQVIKMLIDGLECFAKGQQPMNTEIEIKG
jgi:hypothetical protein